MLAAREIVDCVRELPPVPAVVLELLRTLGDDRMHTGSLAEQIVRDPALAAKMLRLANSPFYGLARQVGSVADAASILGVRTLHSIAAAAGLASSFRQADSALDLQAFWRHSLGVGLCAQQLATQARCDASEAFTAGLLHDVGQLALAITFPQAHAEIVAHRLAHDCPPLEAERAVIGTDHATVGRLIADHWGLPASIGAAIAAHHGPQSDAGPATLVDVVHVADNLAHALGLAGDEDELVPPLSGAAWGRLALAENACHAAILAVEAQHATICEALKP